jgi:hypothetical protein
MVTQRLAVFFVTAAALTVTLFAHHGTSVTYEMDRTITVTGTVTEFDFSYPHPALFLDVKDEDGTIVKWGVEFLPTPAVLRDMGWTNQTIQFGDTAVLDCHPSKTGAPVCALQSLSINGEALPLGAGPGAAPGRGGRGRGQ